MSVSERCHLHDLRGLSSCWMCVSKGGLATCAYAAYPSENIDCTRHLHRTRPLLVTKALVACFLNGHSRVGVVVKGVRGYISRMGTRCLFFFGFQSDVEQVHLSYRDGETGYLLSIAQYCVMHDSGNARQSLGHLVVGPKKAPLEHVTSAAVHPHSRTS